jgi:hypothetical protein
MLRYVLCIVAVTSSFYITQYWEISQWYHQTLTDYTGSWQLNLDYYSENKDRLDLLKGDDDWSWVLETNEFVPNQYQRTPYVSNGYIGQRLPAEGVGYWIDVDEDGEYVKNCKTQFHPPFSQLVD